MGIAKRSLILWILVLGLCVGIAVLVPAFRANKASKLANQSLETEGVQKEQTENLSKIGDTALKPLIVTLKNEDKDVRERAAKTLGEIEDNSSIEPLAIKDKRVRYREIEALEKTGDIHQVVELLISALKDEDMEVRGRAVEALDKMGDIQIVESLI